jgi:vacuolar-type H+-ATPase subunit F/Vma7
MGRVAVIGETVHVEGFALAGATVICTEDATGARDAWLTLADDAPPRRVLRPKSVR